MEVHVASARCVIGDQAVDGIRARVIGQSRRPNTRVEHAGRGRLRISVGDHVRAYARLSAFWDAFAWLLTDVARDDVLAPIGAPAARARGGPDSAKGGWWSGWMRAFVHELGESGRGPLFDGDWGLAPIPLVAARDARAYPRRPDDGLAGPPPCAHGAERVVAAASLTHDDWGQGWGDVQVPMGALFPLRAPSLATSSRVKAWRKHAAAASLPPALLLYVSVFGAYVVLDGHDRIHAALLDGHEPPLVALFPVREVGAASAIAKLASAASLAANAAARDALEAALRREVSREALGARTRAWPVPGGVASWERGVRAALAKVEDADDDDISFLLRG